MVQVSNHYLENSRSCRDTNSIIKGDDKWMDGQTDILTYWVYVATVGIDDSYVTTDSHASPKISHTNPLCHINLQNLNAYRKKPFKYMEICS